VKFESKDSCQRTKPQNENIIGSVATGSSRPRPLPTDMVKAFAAVLGTLLAASITAFVSPRNEGHSVTHSRRETRVRKQLDKLCATEPFSFGSKT
jgi:hypothetical protein